MTRWSKLSARIPAEPGLYRVLVELDDGTLEEQVAGWSECECFRGAGGQPLAVIAWGEGRPSDRDPRDDPREGDELLDCDGSRRLLVDMVTGEYVYVRVTDGAGGLLRAVRVARWRWPVIVYGFRAVPP